MKTDLDKDQFCKLWVENPDALREIEVKTVLVRELYEERKSLANFLIDQAENGVHQTCEKSNRHDRRKGISKAQDCQRI